MTKAQARRNGLVALTTVVLLVIVSITWIATKVTDDGGGEQAGGSGQDSDEESTTTTTAPYEGFSDPAVSGQPWTTAKVEGLLTFRGNPTRSYYGKGPVPSAPSEAYRFPPEGGMCKESHNLGETKVWCGMGWTGQPAVFEREGRTWVVFGAYDGHVHFMDAKTGERILPDFPTGDLIKGSVTIDPDGFPLVYSGSRDNFFRVLSIDGDEPVELYKLSAEAVSPVKWNDDWDSSPMIIDDYLFEGGENSQFHILKLNRGYDANGRVTVAPELIFHTPSWDDELLAALPDEHVSVEASPTIVGNTVYFPNSGGLVQGWDLSGLGEGKAPTRTFRYWVGDDADATIVADEEGMLYVSVEYERALDRAKEVGQLVKLDPSNPTDPFVWSVADHDVVPGGIWSTPAVTKDTVYTSTNGGRLMGIDRKTGAIRWTKQLPGPVWGSPVIVDDVLLEGDCDGKFHAFDVSDPTVDPPELWSLDLGGCIEATPAVWKGQIYIGTRTGFLHVLKDR